MTPIAAQGRASARPFCLWATSMRLFEQLFGEGHEFFDRKAAMPFIRRLCERE